MNFNIIFPACQKVCFRSRSESWSPSFKQRHKDFAESLVTCLLNELDLKKHLWSRNRMCHTLALGTLSFSLHFQKWFIQTRFYSVPISSRWCHQHARSTSSPSPWWQPAMPVSSLWWFQHTGVGCFKSCMSNWPEVSGRVVPPCLCPTALFVPAS